MTKKYRRINTILGWLTGILASAVYIITAEPTASWWDCGEYIATTYKMLIGHPPGAPTFQLIGRIFSMFAGDDVTKVAFCVNCMSAICSGLTIMFLFWTVTMLGRKLVAKFGEMTPARTIALFGSALVGSLAYTFSDTFWFSAVEGEVYAMSSFFTALVFWCILKWDVEYDNPKSNVNPNRWIVLIAYLIGLSIGVHLLNLLTLPAVVLIIYFKISKKASIWGVALTMAIILFAASFFFGVLPMIMLWLIAGVLFYFAAKHGALKSLAEWGVFLSLIGSFALLGIILYGIIPGVVSWAGKFEIFFINSIGMPFNSGTIIFFLILFGLTGWGLWYSFKKRKKLLTTGIFAFLFILIGYSTFFTLVIRSNANPTIDENNPQDAVSLLAYLNREQYGSTPLIYGQLYNSRVIDLKDGNPVYVRDNKAKKYVVSKDNKRSEYKYHPQDCMLFPRMWDADPVKVERYKSWLLSQYSGSSVSDKENRRAINKDFLPTWSQNVKFLQTYQFNYMYFRYFMWNFSGRQNGFQGMNNEDGNWITGIPPVDNALVGTQTDLPPSMKNKGHNTYYMLPLLLGLLGLFFHSSKDGKNAFIVFLLFVMTGLAIAFYLNMQAFQPRERDYAFAASFYAFAIWIGFGVYALYSFFEKLKNKRAQVAGALLVTLVCLGLVPGIMASQNWDDHSRAHRYTALAIAKNYLDSCEPNAILFTLGDNDTFPLWYAQEVEGFRTDVRVCNLSLLSAGWYVDQMKRQAYESAPLPISLTWDQYKDGTRDVVSFENGKNQFVDLKKVMSYIASKDFDNQRFLSLISSSSDDARRYGSNGKPTPGSFSLAVDKAKVLANGTVAAKDSALIVDRLTWNLNKTKNVSKAYIIMMDILANNNWERPVYYASTMGPEGYLGLEEYFQCEGLAYRLVPIKTQSRGDIGRIDADILYNNLMNVFDDHTRLDKVKKSEDKEHTPYQYLWGGLNDPRIYNCEDNMRLMPTIRMLHIRTAERLMAENRYTEAEKILDHANQVLPDEVIPYKVIGQQGITQASIMQARSYLQISTPTAQQKGLQMIDRILYYCAKEFEWYEKANERAVALYQNEISTNFALLNMLIQSLDSNQMSQLKKSFEQLDINKTGMKQIKRFSKQLSDNIRGLQEQSKQQAIARDFMAIKQIERLAQITNNTELEKAAMETIETQLKAIEAIHPPLANEYRQLLNSSSNMPLYYY